VPLRKKLVPHPLKRYGEVSVGGANFTPAPPTKQFEKKITDSISAQLVLISAVKTKISAHPIQEL
jgi:hypothetical protein